LTLLFLAVDFLRLGLVAKINFRSVTSVIFSGDTKMSHSGLKQARELTVKGFYYDNLVEMAEHCREEVHPDRILSAYVLNRVFVQLADDLGDGPIIMNELRKLEARFRNMVNLALEKAIAGAPQDEQNRILIEIIQLLWTAPSTD
jgi:hypothetical protein